jgi:mono/diheme cytochrome c family protein
MQKLTTISFAALSLAACSTRSTQQAPTPTQSPVARGEQLVRMGGCSDCHTPMKFDAAKHMPVPDMTRFLSGHPEGAPDPEAAPGSQDQAVIGPTFTSFKTGFGIVYSRNLTPDKETGLGAWTQADFVATMRTGHRQGKGRVLLPPMPWMNLASASESDLHAIFAYLQSLEPVHNAVPDPKVPAPAIQAIEASYASAAKGGAS